MARKRMLDPSFFVDETVASLPPLARLLFQGLWGQADREGRLEDRPVRLKVQILPYDDCDVDSFLSLLAGARLILRYSGEGGTQVIQIRSFKKHQKPHPKEAKSVLPAPSVESREKTLPAVKGTPESFPSESESKSESVRTELRLTPPAPTKPVIVRSGWAAEACDSWAAFLGTPNGGKIGAALKPLVEKHTWDVVRPIWSDACAEAAASAESKFFSPAKFAESFLVEQAKWLAKRPKPPRPRREAPWERIAREEAESDAKVAR